MVNPQVLRVILSILPLVFSNHLLVSYFPPTALLSPHFCADWLPMIGARQPSGHHFLMLVSQHGEDLKTMMAEPAGVIVYDGSLSY